MKLKLGQVLSLTVLVLMLFSGPIASMSKVDTAAAASLIQVNSTLDSLANDGRCTLREAVISANRNKASGSKRGECFVGGADDTILLQAGLIYQLTRNDSGNEDASTTGDLDIFGDLTIRTDGAGLAVIQAVNFNDRVFHIFSGSITLSNLQIAGGNVIGDGGGILNLSTLIMNGSHLTGNQANSRGGGIMNVAGAALTITNSTFSRNTAKGDGGGLFNEGVFSIKNSTVSGNTAAGSGGGIYNSATATLDSVTVASNFASSRSGNGGGLAASAGTFRLRNSLVSGNLSLAAAPAQDCFGPFQSNGYNLLSNPAGCTFSGSQGDLIGIDPLLTGLANNGGPTPTHALMMTSTAISPAIEAGICTTSSGETLSVDQRGVERPQGVACDIGAFEVVNPIQIGPVYSVKSVFDVTGSACTVSDCTLRDAINAANTRPNGAAPDEIHFNLPGNNLQTIFLETALPAITDPLLIDGFTQAGASPGDLTTGSSAVQTVVLAGSQMGACSGGILLSSSGSTVRGLVIQSFECAGINVDGSDNQIEENAILNNLGYGVLINSGAGNRVTGNSIHRNTAGGIFLAPAANHDQSAPIAAVAAARIADAVPGTDIGGILTGEANSSYTVELFENPTCTAAQGQIFRGTAQINTDADGQGSFLANIKPPLASGSGATITSTGPDGSTSPFSECIAVGTLNDSWLTAAPVTLIPGGGTASAQAETKIYQAGQTRWFKFPVSPGGQVELTISGAPGTIVTLHKDLLKTYNALESVEDAGALSASDLSGGYLPGGYLPGGYLPGGYLPGGYLPGGYLPGGYLPGGYLPGGYLPGGYLPGGYLPGGYLPGGYLPGGYLPTDFLPGGYLPGGYLPELYSGSIRRSLLAISNTGQEVQTVLRNTWDLSEDFYVQLSGPASLTDSLNLQITYQSGICQNIPSLPPLGPDSPVISGVQPAAGSSRTLILWDSDRMLSSSSADDIGTLRAKLDGFASRGDIQGQVIDLAAQVNGQPLFPRLAQANQISDANAACVTAKNTVATEIKNIIDIYRAANAGVSDLTTLQYILLAGSDYEIPFFRYPDLAELASEVDYVPPVKDDSSSEASLRQARVLGQDEYGAQSMVSRSGYALPVPQLAVSRLVRTASQISGMLDAYINSNGLLTPSSALVTGYDFVSDTAEVVANEFTQGLNSADCASLPSGCTPVDTLIQPQANGLVGAWTADDLRGKLFPSQNEPPSLIFFAGHFSAGGVLAADYTSSMQSLELFNSPADFSNSLVFALGCHSGYSIPGPDALSFSPVPDWAETFSEKQASFIASTGYAYGDTDLVEYGERLFEILTQKLHTGTGPVALGQALVESKREYMSEHAAPAGIDDKTMLEITLYGLPMMKINFEGERIPNSEPAAISGALPVSSGPGTNLGLQVSQPLNGGEPGLIVINPSLTRHSVLLTNLEDQTSVTAVYYSGKDGVTARPAEPVLPSESYNVSVSGLTLRGAGFRGGVYSDEANITPLTSASTTENSRSHPAFYTDFFYPLQNWAANLFGSIDGNAENAVLTPAQYRSNTLSSTTGILRTFQEMDFRFYYLEKDWPASSNPLLKAAAVSAAPDIQSISMTPGTSTAHFQVRVLADPSAGVQEVWVTFTASSGIWYGLWLPLDLTRSASNPAIWEGDLSLPQGISPQDLHYLVQAVNGAGSVSLVDPSLPPAAAIPDAQTFLHSTQIVLEPVDAEGFTGDSQLVTATLLDAINNNPIQERTLVFALTDSSNQVVLVQPAITNYAGKAVLGALDLPAGSYALNVYYGSTVSLTGEVVDLTSNTYLGSSAAGTITLINGTPLANSDAYTLQEDEILSVPPPGVLDNDTDLENEQLTAILAGNPSHGAVALLSDGSFSYTPDGNFYGVDSFSYTAGDGTDSSQPAEVTLTINAVQDAPVAVDDTALTSEDTPVVIQVMGNDTDSDGETLTVTEVSIPTNGTASTDGLAVVYTPAQGFSGLDSFSYTITDGIDSATATVQVTVSSVNHNPICTAAAPSGGIWIWPPNNNIFVPVSITGVTDPDGDPVSINITGIYQDEKVKAGGFTPDGMGLGTDTAQVRAERDGSGDGRVYHIYFIATDGRGGSCEVNMGSSTRVRVGVSDNQSDLGLDPIDGGPRYDSTVSSGAVLFPSDPSDPQLFWAIAKTIRDSLNSSLYLRRRLDFI